MNERCIANECLEKTGFSYTLSLINGKYKMTILYVPEIKYQEYVLSDWRRFTNIYFSLSSSIDEISNDNIAVWSKGDTIYIEGIGIVSIYDTLGKLVYKGDSRESSNRTKRYLYS